MAYLNGQEIDGAVISHHLYEHNIFLSIPNGNDNDTVSLTFFSEDKDAYTATIFFEKVLGRGLVNNLCTVSTGYGFETRLYTGIVKDFQTEGNFILYYLFNFDNTSRQESITYTNSMFLSDTVKQIF